MGCDAYVSGGTIPRVPPRYIYRPANMGGPIHYTLKACFLLLLLLLSIQAGIPIPSPFSYPRSTASLKGTCS